jgi:predicted PurR-regulated permease PerM
MGLGRMSNPGRERFNQVLFYALVLLMGYLAFAVLRPFLGSLAWAAIFAMMFHPVQVQLSDRLGPNRAALVTTSMAAVLIVGPAVMIVSVLAREVPILIEYLKSVSVTPDQIQAVWDPIRQRSPFELPADPTSMLRQGAQRLLAFVAPRAGAVVADVLSTLGSLGIMILALFFLLRDGHVLARQIRELLPLSEQERERIVVETRDLVAASVGAALAVAATQGAIGGIAFWALGIGAPVVWGVVMGMTSLIPVVGAALVWLPTALWLLMSGEVIRGLILLVVGVLAISMADNVLRPLLLSGRTSAGGLVVFLGLLGGVSAFGFVGLVLGPIVLVTAGGLLRAFTRPDLVETPTPGVDSAGARSGPVTLQ